uniref:Uncharacterized protein n=1 Tax=Oryza punctata TaxID=4537 RepID=A0A0E0MMZ4_ORYPU
MNIQRINNKNIHKLSSGPPDLGATSPSLMNPVQGTEARLASGHRAPAGARLSAWERRWLGRGRGEALAGTVRPAAGGQRGRRSGEGGRGRGRRSGEGERNDRWG